MPLPESEYVVPRSPLLVSRQRSALLVVDVQEKLIPALPDAPRLLWNLRRLIDGARLLQVPIAATEQYPQGLGPTVEPLRARLAGTVIPDKLTFSCRGCHDLFAGFASQGIEQLVVAGIEAHVCVLQTVIDALSEGYQVFVVTDAVSARSINDQQVALRRCEANGAHLITTEMALFEWCERAGTAEFKQVSALVRESPP